LQYTVKSRKPLNVLKSRALTISTHSAMIKATKLFSSLLFFTFLALLLFIITAPYLWGFSFLMVMGGSMGPALSSGSVAMVQPVNVSEIEVGDIIAYQPRHVGSTVTTHRVINIIRQEGDISFQTAGDHNEFADKYPVPSDCVLGKMQFHIPFLGYIFHFLKQPFGYILLVGLPAIVMVTLEVRGIYSQIRLRKKTTAIHAGSRDSSIWRLIGFSPLLGRLDNHDIDQLSRWGIINDIQHLPRSAWILCLKSFAFISLIAITGFFSWNLLSQPVPQAIFGGIGVFIACTMLIWLLVMFRKSWVLYSIKRLGETDY